MAMDGSPESTVGAVLNALAELAPTERDQIDALAVTRTFKPGEHLLRQGQPCGHVWFLQQGLVRVYFLRDGLDPTAWFVAEGGFVSDYVSFLSREPATMSIEALEPTRVQGLSREAIETIYRQVERGDRLGRLLAEQLFVATHRRLSSFYLEDAEDRYRAFLRDYPGLLQRIPQHLVASFVGVRPQSLSRIRRRMAGEATPPEGQGDRG
jgi:CRP-like cAMP-binding protein